MKSFALFCAKFDDFMIWVLRPEFDSQVAPALLRFDFFAEVSLHGEALSRFRVERTPEWNQDGLALARAASGFSRSILVAEAATQTVSPAPRPQKLRTTFSE
ncbi:MAG: hypothetical protein H8E31_03830 [Planctomycetes bacterium]|nr:hypothetical protein [Planctomycetota bacterium]